MDRATIRLRNVRALIKEAGGPADFARRVGMSDSQVGQVAGPKPTRGIGNIVAGRIEVAFNKPTGWLDAIHDLEQQNPPEAPDSLSNAEIGPTLGPFGRIPVVGTAQLGDNGHWAELSYPVGHGDGYLDYPSRDRAAYAVRCRGDSMKPRIKHGEFVVVEPSRAVQPGDEVLVKSVDGRVMVKQLVAIRDDGATLLSVNEMHGTLTIELAQIVHMHYVAAIVRSALWRAE